MRVESFSVLAAAVIELSLVDMSLVDAAVEVSSSLFLHKKQLLRLEMQLERHAE